MSRSSCLLHACAVDVMRGKPDVGNFPACGSPGLVTPGLRRRRAYRRAYIASTRLTTTDIGLTPRLAYARVVHTAPDDLAVIAETEDELIKRLNVWKDNVESRGMRVNMNKTKVMISGECQKVR